MTCADCRWWKRFSEAGHCKKRAPMVGHGAARWPVTDAQEPACGDFMPRLPGSPSANTLVPVCITAASESHLFDKINANLFRGAELVNGSIQCVPVGEYHKDWTAVIRVDAASAYPCKRCAGGKAPKESPCETCKGTGVKAPKVKIL